MFVGAQVADKLVIKLFRPYLGIGSPTIHTKMKEILNSSYARRLMALVPVPVDETPADLYKWFIKKCGQGLISSLIDDPVKQEMKELGASVLEKGFNTILGPAKYGTAADLQKTEDEKISEKVRAEMRKEWKRKYERDQKRKQKPRTSHIHSLNAKHRSPKNSNENTDDSHSESEEKTVRPHPGSKRRKPKNEDEDEDEDEASKEDQSGQDENTSFETQSENNDDDDFDVNAKEDDDSEDSGEKSKTSEKYDEVDLPPHEDFDEMSFDSTGLTSESNEKKK